MPPLTHGSAYQEFAVLPASAVAPKPAGPSFAQAAAVPLADLTAWRPLDAAHVAAGQRVLVHAGAGGVGHFAVQLAKARGAHVAATASPRDVDFQSGRSAPDQQDRPRPRQTPAHPVTDLVPTIACESPAS